MKKWETMLFGGGSASSEVIRYTKVDNSYIPYTYDTATKTWIAGTPQKDSPGAGTQIYRNEEGLMSTPLSKKESEGIYNWSYDVGGTGANWNLTEAEKYKLLNKLLEEGRPLTDQELIDLEIINDNANKVGTDRFTNLQQAMASLINNNSTAFNFTAADWNLDVSGTGANWNLTETEKYQLIKAIQEKGSALNEAELRSLGLLDANGSARVENLVEAQDALINNNINLFGFDTEGNTYELDSSIAPEGSDGTGSTGGSEVSAIDDAYNKYYQDLYSQREGTLGKKILDNNVSLYEKEAANAATIAAASVQSQALAQAQGVKQVTDQIRAERLAQLRAGMSESQLADRELTMLMGSVNQFTNQGAQANQDALVAELAKSTARETAFNDYITQTTALGQNAAASYAANAGDAMAKAFEYQRQMAAEGKTVSIDQAYKFVTAQPAS